MLEQERARLMERLRECTASIDGTSLVDATEIGSSEKTALKAEEADLRKRLEAAIEAEKAHNLETCERLDRYQAEFNSAQSRMEDELSRHHEHVGAHAHHEDVSWSSNNQTLSTGARNAHDVTVSCVRRIHSTQMHHSKFTQQIPS